MLQCSMYMGWQRSTIIKNVNKCYQPPGPALFDACSWVKNQIAVHSHCIYISMLLGLFLMLYVTDMELRLTRKCTASAHVAIKNNNLFIVKRVNVVCFEVYLVSRIQTIISKACHVKIL